MKFQDVKVGDSLIYMHRYGISDRSYKLVEVIKVTKSRFTTSYGNGERPRQWTKDGCEYPSNKERWRITTESIEWITPELSEEMRLDIIKRNFLHTVKMLGDRSNKYYNKLTEQQVVDFYNHAALILNLITEEAVK